MEGEQEMPAVLLMEQGEIFLIFLTFIFVIFVTLIFDIFVTLNICNFSLVNSTDRYKCKIS